MFEIQISADLQKPSIAVCPGGNICLYLPADWDINEALTSCEPDLLHLLHIRFKALFADSDYPRNFYMTGDRLAIQPDLEQLPNREVYFEKFLDI